MIKKYYIAHPLYITVWNQKVIYIFISWKFLISLKFHGKQMKGPGVYERKLMLHLIRDKQAEMCSQFWNIWRSGKAHETSSGRSPPASVTTPQLSAVSDTKQWWRKEPCVWMERGCDCYKHSQLYEWEIHHSNGSKGKRCEMDPRVASMS